MDNAELEPYKKQFSENSFWKKLKRQASKAGVKVVYTALLLYHAYLRSDTPYWAKSIVLGTLGYLLSPIDALPDLTPFVGYTDDLGVMSVALVAISAYINADVRSKAREQLTKWFPKYEPQDLQSVDDKI